MFEDSLNGIQAGYRAGCKAIMIPDLIIPTEQMKNLSYGIYDTLTRALNRIRKDFAAD